MKIGRSPGLHVVTPRKSYYRLEVRIERIPRLLDYFLTISCAFRHRKRAKNARYPFLLPQYSRNMAIFTHGYKKIVM